MKIPLFIPDRDAYPHAKPIREGHMHAMSRRYTVCQILREIHAITNDADIKMRCRVASRMAKSICDQLSECKPGWKKNFFPWRKDNKDFSDPIKNQYKTREL